jgi:hypothetical protein
MTSKFILSKRKIHRQNITSEKMPNALMVSNLYRHNERTFNSWFFQVGKSPEPAPTHSPLAEGRRKEKIFMLPPCHNPLACMVGGGSWMFLRFLGRITVLWNLGDGIEEKARIGPLKGWGKGESSLPFR